MRPLCGSEPTNPTPRPGGACLGKTGSQCYGGHGERETPGHIPNPEAKPLSADGTALETGWESRTPPDNPLPKGPQPPGWGPFAYPRPTPYRHKARLSARNRGQGTVRRRPAHERAARTIASAAGSVTASVTTERSANHVPTRTHVPSAVIRTARPPKTASAPTIRPQVPALPQRLFTTPIPAPQAMKSSMGAPETSTCSRKLSTSRPAGAQNCSPTPQPSVAPSIAVRAARAMPYPRACATPISAVPR